MNYPDKIKAAADFIRSKTDDNPGFGINTWFRTWGPCR